MPPAKKMFHRPECREFRLWKKQQADLAKLKMRKEKEDDVKKGKRKKQVLDCIDKDESKEEPKPQAKSKVISSERCKEGQKKKKTVKKAPLLLKRTSMANLILKRIQPPIPDRERYLAKHHANCFIEKTVDAETIRSMGRDLVVPPPGRKRKKGKGKVKKKKTEEEEGEETRKEEQKGEATEGEATEGEGTEDEEAKLKEEEKKKKKKKRKRKKKRKEDGYPRREALIFTPVKRRSVCSFDSDVCLAGLALTVDDREIIEEKRREMLKREKERIERAERMERVAAIEKEQEKKIADLDIVNM